MTFDNSKLASQLSHVLLLYILRPIKSNRPKCELFPPQRLQLGFPIKIAISLSSIFPLPIVPCTLSLFFSPVSLQHKRGLCGGEKNAKINVVAYSQECSKFSVIFVLNLISSFHKISVATTSNLCSENEMISMSRAWGKEKIPIGVPDRIRTYVLPNTGRALYPLELRRT